MSVGRPNGNEFISPETYVSNQAKIEQARKLLEDMERKNEIGLQNFTERDRQQQAAQIHLLKQKEDLQKKIQEGLEAQRLIEELERGQLASEMPEIASARIEEVHDNIQSMSPAIPEVRLARSQSSNILPQYQNQTVEQPQQFVNPSAQLHAYSSGITAPLAGPLQHPQNPPSLPYSPYGPYSYTATKYAASSTQQPYGSHTISNIYMPASTTFRYPTQPLRESVGSGAPSQQIPFAPTVTGSSNNDTRRDHQHIPIPNESVYQSAAVPLFNVNEYPRRSDASSSHDTSLSNTVRSSSGRTHSIAEKPVAPQLPPPQLVNSRFVDNSGVPYIALTDEQILGLRRQFDNWRQQAPPGTIDKLHDMLYLHKDREAEPVTWIYVPVVPGGTQYARTSDIDKFFNILLDNARQTRRMQAPQAATQPTASDRHVPIAKTNVTPTVPISERRKQSRKKQSLSTSNTMSSASSSAAKPTAQSPAEVSTTPSGPARNLPLPNSVDKKHLSQSLLFALGKRSRASTDTPANGPAKKRATDVSASKDKLILTTSSSEPAIETGSVNLSEKSGPSIATSISNISSSPPLAQVTPIQPKNESSHSISTPSVNNISATAHQQPIIPETTNLPPLSTAAVSANDIPPQKPADIKISSTTKPAATAGLSKASDLQPSLGISDEASSLGGADSVQQKAVNPSSGTLQHQPAVATATATAARSVNGEAKVAKTTSAQYNPYLPLLSIPEPYGLKAQHGQWSTGSFPAASSSSISQVGSFSYNEISTSQRLLPEASTSKGRLKKQKEPLFLPSISPERGLSQASVKYKAGEDSRFSKTGKKENRAYVLVPEPPEYLVRYRQRTAYGTGPQSDTEVTRQMMQSLRTGTSSVSTSVVGEEDVVDELQHESVIEEDNTEQQAIDLACSRLQPLTCRWNGCNVDLNSINALIQHLELHKPVPSANDRFFTCRWSQCGRRCNFNEKHLEKHALLSLRCAFKDCDEFYRTGSRLLKHYNEKHETSELKPSAEFSQPEVQTPPPMPGTLPAYLFVTRLVEPATITPERHEVLCRWVVQNIVNSDQEKVTRMRPRKTAKNAKPRTVAPGHDYEFITARSTRYSSYLSQAVDLPLADLDSANISRMVDAGLTLWAPDENASDREQDNFWNPPPSPSPSEADVKLEMNDAVGLDDNRHQEEQSTDEDAVEDMLTGQ